MKKDKELQKLVLHLVNIAGASEDDLRRLLKFCQDFLIWVPTGTKGVPIHNRDHNLLRTVENVLAGRGLIPVSVEGKKIIYKAQETKV